MGKKRYEDKWDNILLSIATYGFVVIMIALFPLYYQNNYYNIVSAKTSFFKTCAIAFCLIALCILILRFAINLKKIKSSTFNRKAFLEQQKKNGLNLFGVLLFVAVIVSTINSAHKSEAFLGNTERMLGSLFLGLCLLVYFIIAGYLKPTMHLVWLYLIVNLLVLGLADLNFFGIDLLGMDTNQTGFISTIGNSNFLANYDALVLPIGMCLFYISETTFSKSIYSVFLTIGFCGAFASSADSWILGIGSAYLLLLWFSMSSFEKLGKFCQLAGLFTLSSLLIKVGATLAISFGLKTPHLPGLPQSYGYLLLRTELLIAEAILLTVVYLLCRKLGSCLVETTNIENQKRLLNIRKILFGLLLSALLLATLLFGIANAFPQAAKNTPWLSAFTLTDTFGSGRGFIWKYTIRAWEDLSLKDKIFGVGLSNFVPFIYKDYAAELSQIFGSSARLIDAHNEFLQFLVTTGLLGAIGYFGMLISSIVKFGKMTKKQPLLLIGSVTALSYLMQGLVNNPQTFTTPLLFIFFGVMESLYRKYKAQAS
ncbi:O-antigen ligase family protein [Lachnospiraceae bacterium ZAX-1]